MRKISIHQVLPALLLAALPMTSFAFVSIGVSVNIAPPALPVYVQPPCPAVGYIWTPGYWAWDDGDYYWVPGTWVLAPTPGFLWTPGYWGWGEGVYLWHAGYWGPHVGFYGGVNYGFGYGGVGFEGGYWRGGAFFYNRSVANLGALNVTNVYNKTVINNITVNHVSYNGGTGGLTARPTARELVAERDHHIENTSIQREHEHLAASNRELRASVNGGKPAVAATARPAVFSGAGVVRARSAGGPVHTAETRSQGADRPLQSQHAATREGPGTAQHFTQARTDRPPTQGAPAHSVTRAESMPRQPNLSRGESMPRQQSMPRGESAPRQPSYRPENTGRPQYAPNQQTMRAEGMRGQPQPRPEPSRGPGPQARPQPQGRNAHEPGDNRPHR